VTPLSIIVIACVGLALVLYWVRGRHTTIDVTNEKADAMRARLGRTVTVGVLRGSSGIVEERGAVREVRVDGVVLHQDDGDQLLPWSMLVDLREGL